MKKLLIALALALVVAGGLYLDRRGPDPAPAPRPEGAWPEYDSASVRSLSVRCAGASYSLVRRDAGWVLELPGLEPAPLADPAKVGALFDFLAHNKPILRAPGASREAFEPGPGAPALSVDGAEALALGGRDESGVGVWARRGPDGPVVLLAREYEDVLCRDPLSYLDLRLLDFATDAVGAVRLEHGDEAWEIARGKNGLAFVAPEGMVRMRVLTEAFDLWLHEMAALKAMGPAPAAPDPARRPDVSLIVRPAGPGGRPARLDLYAPQRGDGPWTAAGSRQDAYFLLDRERALKVDRNAFSLVDRRLAALDPGAVDRLVLSAPGRELRAARSGQGWRNESASSTLTGIDMFLWRLTDLQYEYGPVGALPASAEERMRLELFAKDGSGLLDLVFYADTGLPPGQCWVARGGTQGFHPVADQIFKDLQGLLPPATEAPAHK